MWFRWRPFHGRWKVWIVKQGSHPPRGSSSPHPARLPSVLWYCHGWFLAYAPLARLHATRAGADVAVAFYTDKACTAPSTTAANVSLGLDICAASPSLVSFALPHIPCPAAHGRHHAPVAGKSPGPMVQVRHPPPPPPFLSEYPPPPPRPLLKSLDLISRSQSRSPQLRAA
jgi:hypothetical protein